MQEVPMSIVRALCLTAIGLAIAMVSTSGFSETFDCRKNEPIPVSESECEECVDVPGGFAFNGTTYFSKSCDMSFYPIDQQCTIETNEDGIICWTATIDCRYFPGGGTMIAWKNLDCTGDPKPMSSCDSNFKFISAGWQDNGNIPICPAE
jgi:hypothetical protein